ncbi:MAG: amidohydrolase family protein, partial [Roseovarius sp.]|nr:amidohydrolase family protein [Roseovarius sp.]
MTKKTISRRQMLAGAAGATGAALGAQALAQIADAPAFEGRGLVSVAKVDNPLEYYPDRDWEKVYRDQYAYDRSFTYICAPNDTHMCRVRAFVRNGVVTRLEQNYDYQRYADLYGNTATYAWNPRMCLKGFTMHRRVYGPYRAKGPMIRDGWKAWADAGFPSLSDNPELRATYRFDSRGTDTFTRMSWDEATTYLAKGLMAVARTYSGEEGRTRLIDRDGYPEEMLAHWEESGTRTIKLGSSLPIHGVIGKFGLFRMANLLGLMDAHVHLWDEPSFSRHRAERGDRHPSWPGKPGTGAEGAVNAMIYARRNLAAGFTTVRDLGSDDQSVFAVRNAINAGRMIGPRILLAGSAIAVTGGHGDTTPMDRTGDEATRIADGTCDGP